MLKYTGRSIAGAKSFSPSPQFLTSQDQKTIVIAVPWGRPEVAQKLAQEILIEIEKPMSHEETVIRGTSSKALLFKSVLQKKHVDILSTNAKEFTEGVEIIILHQHHHHLLIVQSANATTWGLSNNQWKVLLASGLTDSSSPLPECFLGADVDTNIQIRQCDVQQAEQIVICSRSYLPAAESVNRALDFNQLVRLFSDQLAGQPCWLARVETV